MGTIEQDDVIEILKIVGQSDIDELRLEMGDFKLVLNKTGARPAERHYEADVAEPGKTAVPPDTSGTADRSATEAEKLPVVLPEPPKEAATQESAQENGYRPINAPLLGTFYRAPKPGAPPFVEVGQFVTEDDTLCIIEVMKLFNTIKAGVKGTIREICAEDGQLVEFNQTLFRVEEAEQQDLSDKE